MSSYPSEIDKYELIDHLGSGQFSNVFYANDRALDTKKAIKLLDVPDPQNFMKEFEEAQILNKCKHKHIVEVNEANIYEINGELKVIIDMEFIEGGSLEGLMERKFIPATDAAYYIMNILFALEYTHQQGVLHRDIKPANIMLSDNSAKLSDFGLATTVATNLPGSPKGYATHLAPEFFINNETTDLTDIFATGITMFRVVNNITDWNGRITRVRNFTDKIRNGKLISSIGYAPHVPKKIKRVINRACHPDPAKRYKTALKMRQSLEKLSPAICWKFINSENWIGVCCKTGIQHETCIVRKKTDINVDIKKNNRRTTQECKQFGTEEDAFQYMYSYIASSTY